MKKTLLTLLAATAALSLSAEVKVYSFEELGEINGVSDNGFYGALTDPDNGYAYLWNEKTPEQLIDISAVIGEGGNFQNDTDPLATTAMDVSDDGIVVGSIQLGEVMYPAYYKDGKWTLLPLDPNAMNTNEAICITPDAKTIAGYQFIYDPTADTGGKYYPCQWFLNDNGSYTLKSYTDFELPDHLGFFPLTQTSDGKVIAGTVYCGVQSRINALLKDGQLFMFDKVEVRENPFEYAGKYYAGVDENGKQIWVTDVNDPRVQLFKEEYINGYKDDSTPLEGFFVNCDDNGNFYGVRSRVEDVTEDGDGTVIREACIYNIDTEDWYTDSKYSFFSAGIGEEIIFTGNSTVIKDGEITTVKDAYDVVTDGVIGGINKISSDARVLGGVIGRFFEAIGDYVYYPFFVVTGEYAGIQSVAGNPDEGLVVVSTGCIEVANTDDVAVYDLNGKMISSDKKTFVEPGIYIVKTGKKAYKVIVR